jgi:hypothetical protein
MFDPNLVMLVAVGFPILAFVFMVNSLRVQREAAKRSVLAIERQQEAIQMQRHALELAEENLSLQHEIRGLLERLTIATERRV